MKHLLPPIEEIRSVLKSRTAAEVREIAKRADVPVNTLIKFRTGGSKSPQYQFMARVLPHVDLRIETKVVSHG